MNCTELLLIAVTIVVVLLIIYIFLEYHRKQDKTKCPPKDKSKETLVATNEQSPYTALDNQNEIYRKLRMDPKYAAEIRPQDINFWSTTPGDINSAMSQAWCPADPHDDNHERAESFVKGRDMAEKNHGDSGTGIDYQNTLIDLVATPKMREEHAAFCGEIMGKSRTQLRVDTIDEAAALSTYNGHGIKTFSMDGPSQHNPTSVPEESRESYAKINTKYCL